MSALCRWYNWFIAIHWDSGAVTAAATIAIAFVTLILGVATWFLWRATRNLVRGHEIAVRQELRAYVSHEPGGFQWDGVSRRVKYFEKNFGRTPAKDLGMYVSIQNGTAAPPVLTDRLSKFTLWRSSPPTKTSAKSSGSRLQSLPFLCTDTWTIPIFLKIDGVADSRGAMIPGVPARATTRS